MDPDSRRSIAIRAPRGRIAVVLIVLLLGATQAALLARTAWDKSDTADETRYLASAATLWSTGSYRDLCEAPVLPKWGFAVALWLEGDALPSAPLGWQGASALLFDGKRPEELLALLAGARVATIAFVIVGGLFLLAAARRFGDGAALVAYALWCLSPTVLANGSLATLDGWAAAAMCLVSWAAVRACAKPTLSRAATLGAAFGLAAATKITTVVAVPIALAVLAARVGQKESRGVATARTAQLALALLAACGILLWALYGFSVGGVDLANPCPFAVDAASSPDGTLPFPAWIEGLLYQLRHGREGHTNYLFGQTSSSGWWWFYLACLAFKTTIGAQLLSLLAVATTAARARRLGAAAIWVDVALLAYPIALLVLLSAGNHQPNVGFLLPAAPLAMLWMGRAVGAAHAIYGRGAAAIATALLLVGAAESLRVHPHHLMFFNAWAGGPEGGPRYLIHRDDWGQDKRRLAEWQRAHGVERLYYAAYGPRPEAWGITFDPVPCEPRAGVFALQAIEVHRPKFALQRGCSDWLTVEPPDERIGYSIYVYRVDTARLARLDVERRAGQPPFWKSG